MVYNLSKTDCRTRNSARRRSAMDAVVRLFSWLTCVSFDHASLRGATAQRRQCFLSGKRSRFPGGQIPALAYRNSSEKNSVQRMSGHGQRGRFVARTTGFPIRNPTLANDAPTPRFAEMGGGCETRNSTPNSGKMSGLNCCS
jgi:hypothetical protein